MASDRPRVLIVDDEAENRIVLREVLLGEGIEVVGSVADGERALWAARAVQPDVVLMDLRMPGMGGLEAARTITEAMPTVKVVILTVYEEPLPRRSAAEVGAYAYLVKGCSPALLRDIVMQAWRAGLQERQRGGGNGAA